MRAYLVNLNTPRLVLWCYLIWWGFTAAINFDPSPRLWLSSLGISGIVGIGLLFSTVYAKREETTLDRWQVFRFFLIPFCGSSFAALIKDRGYILVFHPTLRANLLAVGCCVAFVTIVWLTKAAEKPAVTTQS